MSYGQPDRYFYNFDLVDFGASDTTDFIKGPKGKAGTLIDVFGSTREVFTATTLPALIQIGNSGDADAYAAFNFGTMADNTGYSGRDGTSDSDWLISAAIAADTEVKVTFRNTTGGSPTGQATVTVVIDWSI